MPAYFQADARGEGAIRWTISRGCSTTPQTSGGLLVSVATERVEALAAAFAAEGVSGVRIGRVEPVSGLPVGAHALSPRPPVALSQTGPGP